MAENDEKRTENTVKTQEGTDKTVEIKDNPKVLYNIFGTNIVTISLFATAIAAESLTNAIILSIYATQSDLNLSGLGIIGGLWALVIVAGVGIKMWWTFARQLQARKDAEKWFIIIGVIAIIVLISVHAFGAWNDPNIVRLVHNTIFNWLWFGSLIAFRIFEIYLPYRRRYPSHSVSFVEYCNMPRSN